MSSSCIDDDLALDCFNPVVDYYHLVLQKTKELESLEIATFAQINGTFAVAAQDLSPPSIIPSWLRLSGDWSRAFQISNSNQPSLGLAQIAIDSAPGSQPASDNTVSFLQSSSLNNPGDAVQENMVQVAATSPSPSPNQEDTQPPKQVKHQCPYLGCLKTFSASGTLKTHLAIHTKERPFKCEVCPASYTTSNRLTVHVREHSGERPYQCEVFGCGYRAKQKCSLRNHAVKHLNAEEKRAVYLEKQRRIPCNDCGRFYKTFESLDQHCWRVHQRGAPSS